MRLTEYVRTQRHRRTSFRKLHGERFRMAFDEKFGILYCDLKIIAGAVPAFRGE